MAYWFLTYECIDEIIKEIFDLQEHILVTHDSNNLIWAHLAKIGRKEKIMR